MKKFLTAMSVKKFILIIIPLWLLFVGALSHVYAGENPHFTKGKEFYAENKYDEALNEFRQVLADGTPDEKKYSYAHIGWILLRREAYDESIQSFYKALEIDPEYFYANEMIGVIYITYLGDHERAIKYLLKAEELHSQDGFVYYSIARYYSLINEKEKALLYIDRAIYYKFRIIKYLKNDKALDNIRDDSRFMKLVANFDSIIQGDEYIRSAEELKTQNKKAESLKCCLDAAGLYGNALWDDSENIDSLYVEIKSLYCDLKDYKNAILYCEKILKLRVNLYGEKSKKTASAYGMTGSVYEAKRDYNTALIYYEKELKLKIELFGENYEHLDITYDKFTSVYESIHDYDRAILYGEKTLKIMVANYGETFLINSQLISLGRLYQNKGDYKRALECYERALKITVAKSGENSAESAICYALIGSLFDLKGDSNRAASYIEKSLRISIAVKGEKCFDNAIYYSRLGMIYSKAGMCDRALEYSGRAEVIIRELYGDKSFEMTSVIYSRGHMYKNCGEYDKALSCYNMVLKPYIEKYGEKSLEVAFCYSCMALVYDSMKNYRLAIEYHARALEIGLSWVGEDNPDAGTAYHNIGWAYWCGGDPVNAIVNLEKAVSILQKFERNDMAIKTYRDLGVVYTAVKKYNEAVNTFRSGVETIERFRKYNLSGGSDFTSRNIDIFYCMLNACRLQKDLGLMFNISERMRAMGYVERLSIGSAVEGAGIDPAMGKRLLQLRDDIERLSSLRQKVLSEPVSKMDAKEKECHDELLERTSKELADAEAEFNKLEAEFMKNDRYRMLRNSGVASVKDAQSLCGSSAAVIEYVIPSAADEYKKPYAIVITGGSINAVELDLSYDYAGRVEEYRKAIKNNNKNEIEITGAELYSKLIMPVESFIDKKQITKLIIVPDGPLSFLPFDSIAGTGGKYLSGRYEVVLTPSVTVSVMIKNRKYNRRDNLVAFGGGNYSGTGESSSRGGSSFRGVEIENSEKGNLAAGSFSSPLDYYNAQQLAWADLPGTEREVSAINEKIYKKKNTDVYKGEKVSEENLKSLSKSGRLKKYSSIHLACHGYYDPEYPAYSAVVFSEVSGKLKESKDDGYMSVEETALLNLQSEIVVLSACETGLGRMVSGDGVIGLTRAFQVAGSNRVLVTLWPVSDEATEAFMVSFYAKVRAGMGYSEALVKVKEEFRRSDKYSAPYYWAGFVLYE